MDTNELISHSRARFSHHQARLNLKEKYQAKMTFAYRGGMWCAGPNLQSTLLTCSGTQAVILDLYETPIQIDTQELLALSQQRWQEQMTAWLVEFETLNQNR